MLIVYSDACVKNGKVGVGWKVEKKNSTRGTEIIDRGHELLDVDITSVEAECLALIRAMREALKYKTRKLIFYTDCKVVVDKISDKNYINEGEYLMTIERYKKYLPQHNILWVSRKNNRVADKEASLAMREQN